jgi:hypothetical protein
MPHYSQHAESRLVIRDMLAFKRWISFLPIPGISNAGRLAGSGSCSGRCICIASFPGVPSRQQLSFGLRNAKGIVPPAGLFVIRIHVSGYTGRNSRGESYLKRSLLVSYNHL